MTIIKSQTTAFLIKAFEETNSSNDENISTVRGWLMDELEARNPAAFEAWMNTEDVEKMDRPSLFF